jgi:hypothetical protein
MYIFKTYTFTGQEQRWAVPEGVTQALFECWGAAGGMPSALAVEGKVRQVIGGSGPANNSFTNNPYKAKELGTYFANNAGYVAGVRTVTPGDIFYVYVGGNGGPGYSTIKLRNDGSYDVAFRGGAAGWNGGGAGGKGAHIYQNLFNSKSTAVHYKQANMPNSAKNGQKWWDTTNSLVKQCNTTYTAGNGTNGKWDKVTHTHPHASGPSGGGGGGATDIRRVDNQTANRILVAGGGGGAGGPFNVTGSSAWQLRACPTAPMPPFGADNTGSGATGPNNTWSSQINYLVGGWGGGGLGGGSGPLPNPAPTTDGGYAVSGEAGGPSTDRHQDGVAPTAVSGAGGKPGTQVAGGTKGHGGSGGTSGTKGQGGTGADATGNKDDWCAGGGGGGGGYYGGGGGGQGFKVHGANDSIRTRGGGGGGGSSYVDTSFSAYVMAGCAQPPFAKGNSGTGANGLGGFARISYRLLPQVKWDLGAPNTSVASAAFTVPFIYSPALTGGPGIAYYIVGSATSPAASVPTSQTTFMVTDPATTNFTANFVAPANGVANSYFVQAVDLDGDASPWLKLVVTGLTTPTAPAFTAPSAGAVVQGAITATWTVGGETPETAFRLGLTGNLVNTQNGAVGSAFEKKTGWRRGGSRVNLALDPGFATTAVWSSTSNAAMTSQATNPGVSGTSGKVIWNEAEDGSAENHTSSISNLVPGQTYRLHLDVASTVTNDPRPLLIRVFDLTGEVTSTTVDLSATTANTYKTTDLEFTATTQQVYFQVVPAGSQPDGLINVLTDDFEAGTVNGWAANAGYTLVADNATPANIYQGDYGLKVTGFNAAGLGASKTITSLMTAGAGGAGWYVVQGYGYAASASDANASFTINGAGVTNGGGRVFTATRNATTLIRTLFYWDGAGAVVLNIGGNTAVSTGLWYDYITVDKMDTGQNVASYGSPDAQPSHTHYFANMLIELSYDEDKTGYGAYFDGGHANGTGLTVSWSGTANASTSYGTGTDVVTSTALSYTGVLRNGLLYLDTINLPQLAAGSIGQRITRSVTVTPSTPTAPTVAMQQNSSTGFIVLTVNAADGANSVKTTYFDIYRGSVRVATNLTPDQTTRVATFYDIPAHAEVATYTVRAFDQNSGWTDTTTGTVT